MTSPMTSVMGGTVEILDKNFICNCPCKAGDNWVSGKTSENFPPMSRSPLNEGAGHGSGNEYSNMPIGHVGIGIGKLQAFFKPTEFCDSTIQVWGKLQTLNMPLHARSEQFFSVKLKWGFLSFIT